MNSSYINVLNNPGNFSFTQIIATLNGIESEYGFDPVLNNHLEKGSTHPLNTILTKEAAKDLMQILDSSIGFIEYLISQIGVAKGIGHYFEKENERALVLAGTKLSSDYMIGTWVNEDDN